MKKSAGPPSTASSISRSVAQTVAGLRERAPLVQCVTNFVSMDIAANVLNAVGASPAMVHDARESGDFARIASAVAINIGTPSPSWVAGMEAAASVAHEAGVPWVLDPVAVGATSYRREIVAGLLHHRPTVVRGNASEILALATSVASGRGVDSDTDSTSAIEAAVGLATSLGTTIVVSGATDVVTDGERVVLVHGGDPRLPLITALGCSATALVAACCAVTDDPLLASVTAMSMLAAAGEAAGALSAGPGSLRMHLLDELASLDPGAVAVDRIEER